jgi:hypothetical protein
MKPPISVSVKTDNLRTCALQFQGADGGEPTVVTVPADGNVYQGLHAAREGLEKCVNDVLAAHGIVPDPEPSPDQEVQPETSPGGETPEDAKKDKAPWAGKSKKKDASAA